MGNDHSRVEIKPDKPGFFAGETVTGTIFVHAAGGFASKGLFLKVKGYEACCFHETASERNDEGELTTTRVERKGKREFFKIKYQVHSFPCVPLWRPFGPQALSALIAHTAPRMLLFQGQQLRRRRHGLPVRLRAACGPARVV